MSINPAAIATDSHGFVYVAGNTTASDFPVTNALETQPPQGALEVSSNGAPFVNAGIGLSPTANYSGVTAVAASSDGTLVIVATASSTYRSTDGGVTWNRRRTHLPRGRQRWPWTRSIPPTPTHSGRAACFTGVPTAA